MSIITLYDIASTHPGQAWSPSTAKARQGIAHKTVFLEYSEIEPLCKKLGAKPTSQTSPQYTFPVIYDPATGYFRQTREELFGGRRLEDVTPTGNEHTVMWKKVEDAFGQVDGWIRKNGAESKYFMGDTICYADVTVAGFLRWGRKVLGKDKWEEIMTWHDGQWANLMKEMEKYDVIFLN
ncbi:hypothetical protein B0H14DRAFT_2600317 [Mycena olivaceomarginata]|nr:hypothetical protein B0H14DRAFT_2600317 [Mycena olivaceomarginata]